MRSLCILCMNTNNGELQITASDQHRACSFLDAHVQHVFFGMDMVKKICCKLTCVAYMNFLLYLQVLCFMIERGRESKQVKLQNVQWQRQFLCYKYAHNTYTLSSWFTCIIYGLTRIMYNTSSNSYLHGL